MQNEIINKYITSFNLLDQSLNGQKDSPLHELRRKALKSFTELGFPGRKDEQWKYTDVASFKKSMLEAFVKRSDENVLSPGSFNNFDDIPANKLVFVNGNYESALSTILDTGSGITIGSLKQNIIDNEDLIMKHFGKSVDIDTENFSALNTAFAQDGAFIHLKKNTVLKYPVFLLFINDGQENIISNPRNLILIEENSKIQIIEDSQCVNNKITGHTNLLSEIVLEQSAQVNHTIIQDHQDSYHQIATYKIIQKRDSLYKSTTVSLGGKLIRNNMEVFFEEDHAETDLRGIYISGDRNMIDNHILVVHGKPHCLSNQLFKGIIDDEGQAVFNGKVLVKKDAQKTNAYQSNKNILLSSKATINTKPELEIFADDVKCSHGATSGQLDENAIFYLKARGIPEDKAKSLLTYAFAFEVLEAIPNDSLRKELDIRLKNKLKMDQF